MWHSSDRILRICLIGAGVILIGFAFSAARARNASGFAYNYCVNAVLAPGGTCSDGSYLARTYDRAWSATSGGYPCVYFLTAAGYKRGGGTTVCNTNSASMCLVSATPTSDAYVVNGANSGAARAFSGNTDNSPNHTGFCF